MPILHWLNRETSIKEAARVPYRLLKSDPKLSYGDQNTENMLIQGDNLDALKALLPYYAGRVKCIFIDPPYNTQSAFAHYDDNLEHTQWLEMMYPRLELLRELLSEDGSIWVTLDDNEVHYLKVVMDEVFGRSNFVANIIWNSTKSVTNTALIATAHTHTILYFKDEKFWRINRHLFRLPELGEGFSNPDNDPRGPWKADPFQVGGWRPNQQYSITNPNTGKVYRPNKNSSWKNDYEKFQILLKENRIVFGKNGLAAPQRKRFLCEAEERGKVVTTLWTNLETTTNGTQHSKDIFGDNPFSNPKPEGFIQQILTLATNENDLVLDSFLGSGTTAAVAHKMKRRYVGIEMGEHAKTHCALRLQKVIDGEQGGISKDTGWQGGGGFRFYHLDAVVFDENGHINPNIRFPHLAAHIWFCETKMPYICKQNNPLLGIHNGIAYYLLYNGILGDKRINGGNVLTRKILEYLPDHTGPKVIYGETSRIGPVRLAENQITFKQIPYDIKAR